MGALFTAATSVAALTAAWEDLRAADRADGVLNPSITRFADGATQRLADLAESLAAGAYRPLPATEVILAEGGQDRRRLQIPPVRDRVVEKALAAVLTPIVDPVLGPSSFGYRPGLGVADAVQAVVALRAEGLAWVARTDVDDCFPSVDVPRVRRLLGALVDDTELLGVIDALLSRDVARPNGSRRLAGLAQGSEPGRAGVLLTRAGCGVLLDGYERRMLQVTRGALPGFSGSLRRHLYRQAQRISGHLESGQDWTGLSWR